MDQVIAWSSLSCSTRARQNSAHGRSEGGRPNESQPSEGPSAKIGHVSSKRLRELASGVPIALEIQGPGGRPPIEGGPVITAELYVAVEEFAPMARDSGPCHEVTELFEVAAKLYHEPCQHFCHQDHTQSLQCFQLLTGRSRKCVAVRWRSQSGWPRQVVAARIKSGGRPIRRPARLVKQPAVHRWQVGEARTTSAA